MYKPTLIIILLLYSNINYSDSWKEPTILVLPYYIAKLSVQTVHFIAILLNGGPKPGAFKKFCNLKANYSYSKPLNDT